jgi:Integrase core domain
MTGAEIAECLGMALSTVSAVLTRIGLGKLSRLEPPEPPNRYERRHPGELIHVDVKKLGVITGAGHRVTGRRDSQNANRRARRRGAPKGWEFVHVCIDDATRLAYAEVLADEKGPTAAGFLRRAVAFYEAHGITVERVMSDNGACYRSVAHAIVCRALGLKHLRTRPYRPRTNGKACVSRSAGRPRWRRGSPAPVGLTQAKACRRSRFLLNRPGSESCSLGLRSICRPAGCGRAGEGDLIGDSRRCGCTDTEASLAGPASILDPDQEVIEVVRRHRLSQASSRRRAARRARRAD